MAAVRRVGKDDNQLEAGQSKVYSLEGDEETGALVDVPRLRQSPKAHERDVGSDLQGWSRRSAVIVALTLLTSSQGLLIAYSKKGGSYSYSVTSANLLVELIKCLISILSLGIVWIQEGLNGDNSLSSSVIEWRLYAIPAVLYLIKNLLQYAILNHVNAPSYQILKNLNIISTGVLYSRLLSRHLSRVQWCALLLLALGCAVAQLRLESDNLLHTPVTGLVLAAIIALLSAAAGVYTEIVIKTRPRRNIHVHNFYLYVFGIAFNALVILLVDREVLLSRGLFHGYRPSTVIMILNHALSGIAVSFVLKYADNIVKVYSTSTAMLLTTGIAVPLFGFRITVPFVLGTLIVLIATFLHHEGQMPKDMAASASAENTHNKV